MTSDCQEINLALKFAIDGGNKIQETSEDWTSAKKVFHMQDQLSSSLKEKIIKEIKKLEYWKDWGSPHNSPAEGFFCNECKIGITFPMKTRQ
jgi:hypothetical protein